MDMPEDIYSAFTIVWGYVPEKGRGDNSPQLEKELDSEIGVNNDLRERQGPCETWAMPIEHTLSISHQPFHVATRPIPPRRHTWGLCKILSLELIMAHVGVSLV